MGTRAKRNYLTGAVHNIYILLHTHGTKLHTVTRLYLQRNGARSLVVAGSLSVGPLRLFIQSLTEDGEEETQGTVCCLT